MMDSLRVLWRRRRLIGGFVLISTALSAIVISLWPPLFKAETLLLPPQSGGGLSSMALGALGGLAGAGLASQLGVKNPADMYVGMLKSRSIRDAVIRDNHLQSVYEKPDPMEARKTLEARTSIESTKESLIHISVEDRDPKRAADIANSYTDELYVMSSNLAVTDAGQRRNFFEKQLSTEKDKLADAEVALRKVQLSTGLVSPAGQATAIIQSQAQAEAMIASKEVQLQAVRTFATDANPQVEQLQNEIAALKVESNRLRSKTADNGNMFVSGTALVGNSIEYIRALRDVKYHELLYGMLAQSLESSRLEEEKSAPLLQIVDRAVPPTRKSWPPRLGLIFAAALASFLVVALYSIVMELIGRARGAFAADVDGLAEKVRPAAPELISKPA